MNRPPEIVTSSSAEAFGLPDLPLAQRLLDFVFERAYLSAPETFPRLPRLGDASRQLAWRRVTRLPVHPTRGADDQLPLRWQRMLTTLHGWNRRLAVLLVRRENETALYFGTASIDGDADTISATNQLERAAAGEIPGLSLVPLSSDANDQQAVFEKLQAPLWGLRSCGAITGLPSNRLAAGRMQSAAAGIDRDLFSGLGQIAHGLKGVDNHECSYAVVVLADAVADPDISAVIERLRDIGSRVHSEIRKTMQEGQSNGQSNRESLSSFQMAGVLGSMLLPGVGLLGAAAGLAGSLLPLGSIGGMLASQLLNARGTRNEGHSTTMGTEQIDMVAQHCKTVVDRHIDRLNAGRSFGFWNTGIYVLGDMDDTVRTVCGMLRASYSGESSHIEPIRSILFPPAMNAAAFVKDFRHVPLYDGGLQASGRNWHPLGPLYQFVSTPLNTEELAIATALPRKDVPGLRMQKNQVQFAMNGPLLEGGSPVVLGELQGPGGVGVGPYVFDVNGLVRHGLLVGTTGSGKSTTCRRLIGEARRAGVPFLIIEPAKDDYARWAIEHNRKAPPDQQIDLYMPGVKLFDGVPTEPLRLNPIEPALVPGADPDLLGRTERVIAILNASLPMQEVLPILMEEAVMELAIRSFGSGFDEVPADGIYAKIEMLDEIARKKLLRADGLYDDRLKANLYGAMRNRIASLSRGRRGEVLNTERSTPASRLYERPAVINLSRFGSEADKSLIMALLLLGLYEWRMGLYAADPVYRDKARRGTLAHLTIVEEAHTVLRRPSRGLGGEANAQGIVAQMFSDMLAEVRQYGQGLLVVDQDPSQLITGTIKNTSVRIVHRLPHEEDRAALAANMLLRGDQCDFLALLPAGQAVIATEQDDAPCWVKVQGDIEGSTP